MPSIAGLVVFLCLSPSLSLTCSAGQEATEGEGILVNVDRSSFLQSRLEVHATSELSSGELSGETKVSKYTCRGNSTYQSCLFRELCFDRQNQSQNTLFYFSNGPVPFENMTLNVRPLYTNAGWPPPADDGVYITIQAIPGALPEDAAISQDATTVLMQTYFEFNFGHLMDSAFVAYRMQQVFGIPFNARIMTLMAPQDPSWQGFVSKVFSMITRHKQEVGSQSLDSPFVSQLLQMSRNQKPNARYLCFPNMVVGAGPFSFTNPAERSSVEWWRFRGLIIGNSGIGNFSNDVGISQKTLANRWGSETISKTPVTTINKSDQFNEIMKAGGQKQAMYNHYLGRIAMLQQNLQKAFPRSSVNVVDYAKLPMKDQVLMTSNLKALITAPGGGSFVALFLPKGASLIISVEHDLGDDLFNVFENEFLLWKSFQWLSFRNVTDMLSNEVDVEVRKALNRQAGSAPDEA